MTVDPDILKKADDFTAALKGYRTTDHEHRSDVLMLLGLLSTVREDIARALPGATSIPNEPAAEGKPYAAARSTSEAAAMYLEDAGEPVSMEQIIDTIAVSGVIINSDSPAAVLGAALDKRSKNYGDIFKIGRGLWAHKNALSDTQLTALKHRDLTKDGVKKAMERGVKFGQPSKMTPKIRKEVVRLVVEGKTVNEIADAVRLSPSTIRNHYDKKALDEIRAKAREQQEQQRQSPEDSRRDFRVITNGDGK